jgi:hypothetical protein
MLLLAESLNHSRDFEQLKLLILAESSEIALENYILLWHVRVLSS